MTNERIISLYRITNTINRKIYIGQTVQPDKRWNQHRNDAANPKVPFHYAIKKYGAHNFEFEVIASCKNWEDANYIETELVKQYDSFIANGKGYNATHGGMNAPKSEEWKQAMRNYWANLPTEEWNEINQKRSVSFTKYIKENGHIALGTKRTPEQSQNLSRARKEHPVKYTDKIRKNMSDAHIGIKDSEETKQRKTESATEAWEKRIDYSRKCEAPGCEASGKIKYKIIEGIRYCNKHGLRMLRYGRIDTLRD